MSSVFTAFCFIKTISGNNKFVTRTALYRINDEDVEFSEITYKGFTRTAETLISDFEKNLIVCLVQTVPVFSFHNGSACTPDDLPYAFPLLIYSAPTITNSYKANNNVGCQSFMLSKKLYNTITGQKAIDSDVIVIYTNINAHYDFLRDSLKRTVISVIGRLKLSFQSKIPHIISSEIEWSYPFNEFQSSSSTMNTKLKTRKELNSQLNLIEEQYSTMGLQAFKRRKGLTPFASATSISTSPLSASNTSTSTFSASPAYASTSTSSSATTISS
ncbi:33970_t:CDS:2, partial [Gigaspora margarita]